MHKDYTYMHVDYFGATINLAPNWDFIIPSYYVMEKSKILIFYQRYHTLETRYA